MGNDEREIRELVERWMSASREGNTETVLGLMTEDVVFLGAGRPPMVGREAFAAASTGQSAFEISGTSEIQEVKVLGEWAWMWTRLSVVMTPRDGDRPVRREGHTLSVLRKEEGRWRLARDANMLAVVPD
jgi:uncharacterized protein (TIGR02246 family)